MKIVVAPDSFKECLSAEEVAQAMADGVHMALPDADVVCVPVADGGEGTVRALVAATGGNLERTTVTGPLGEPVEAEWGLLGDGAVIEMAAASGLPLVPADQRDPTLATAFGTGELLLAALDRGVRRILLGIGGSATVDGGAGMAQALGARLLDMNGDPIGRGGGALSALDRVDLSSLDLRLAHVQVDVACDADNPLLGPHGAARVYAPQKGATPEMVERLEAGLTHFADVVERDLDCAVRDVPGAGAAGGLGAGLIAFLGARLQPGVDLVLDACGLEEALDGADLVLVGEGRMDRQTPYGKAPVGVARAAARRGIPVVAIVGSLGDGYEAVHDEGIAACFSICDGPTTESDAMARAAELVGRTTAEVLRLWIACGRV
ncbi:glycerate kinase [bacterium]|nr:glycerate kinase [bacterium]